MGEPGEGKELSGGWITSSAFVQTVCLWDRAQRQKNDSLEEERQTVIVGCVRLVWQPEKLSHKSQESSLLCGTCRGREKTPVHISVGVYSLPAWLDCFLGCLLWGFSNSTFLSAELYCPAQKKKRQIKNLQGPLHHWPVTGALRELIFHGSICLGAKILIKMYFIHVKKDCCFQIYLTSIKLCLLLGSCVSRWHSSWDIGQELLFFEDYLHLGSGLQVKSKSYDLSF